MNITYIFGNGFDIQLGLATRYSNFLKEYICPLASDSQNIRKFKQYLSDSKNQELWSDAEIAMGKHLGEFRNSTLDDFTERILDFESCMVEYLEREQAKCTFDDSDKIKKVFIDFIQYSFLDILNLNARGSDIDLIGENAPNIYNFITFNYTDLLDRILECFGGPDSTIRSRIVGPKKYFDQIGAVCHIHGALNSQIIMGVNDESQLNLSGGVTLSKRLERRIIKPTLNAACRHNWDTTAKNLISASDVILIYGVSYGATDAVWWGMIREWMKQDKSHKLICFIRASNPRFNPKIPWQEIEYSEEKCTEILIKMGADPDSEDFTELAEQMGVIVNTSRLNLKKILLPSSTEQAGSTAAAALSKTEEHLI